MRRKEIRKQLGRIKTDDQGFILSLLLVIITLAMMFVLLLGILVTTLFFVIFSPSTSTSPSTLTNSVTTQPYTNTTTVYSQYAQNPLNNYAAGSTEVDSLTLERRTGSAKLLEGKSVLVSIYLNDADDTWDDSEVAKTQSNLAIATAFLENEGASYGKSVELIHDIYADPGLCYTITYNGDIGNNMSNDDSLELLQYMNDVIDRTVASDTLCSQYQTDSIAYLVFIPEDGISYSYPFYIGDEAEYVKESSYLFYSCEGTTEGPDTYAHEILHLFGARDLYRSSQDEGITDSFVNYVDAYYPHEIMYTVYTATGDTTQDYVANDITDITAYFIGWVDSIPELSQFPTIQVAIPGCFSYASGGANSGYSDGDYNCSDGSCDYYGGSDCSDGSCEYYSGSDCGDGSCEYYGDTGCMNGSCDYYGGSDCSNGSCGYGDYYDDYYYDDYYDEYYYNEYEDSYYYNECEDGSCNYYDSY